MKFSVKHRIGQISEMQPVSGRFAISAPAHQNLDVHKLSTFGPTDRLISENNAHAPYRPHQKVSIFFTRTSTHTQFSAKRRKLFPPFRVDRLGQSRDRLSFRWSIGCSRGVFIENCRLLVGQSRVTCRGLGGVIQGGGRI